MWCRLHNLLLSPPYLSLSFGLPLPAFTSSRFFPTLDPKHRGFLTGLLSRRLCAKSTFPPEPNYRSLWGHWLQRGVHGVVVHHFGVGKVCGGRAQGGHGVHWLLIKTSSVSPTVGLQTSFKRSTWKMISQEIPYTLLCHGAFIFW